MGRTDIKIERYHIHRNPKDIDGKTQITLTMPAFLTESPDYAYDAGFA